MGMHYSFFLARRVRKTVNHAFPLKGAAVFGIRREDLTNNFNAGKQVRHRNLIWGSFCFHLAV